jgi:hypothetical protein
VTSVAAFTMRCPLCGMNATVIVWFETAPDLRGFAAANGLAGKTDEEVREAIGDKFPKHIYHSSRRWSLRVKRRIAASYRGRQVHPNAAVIPENFIRRDSRREAESAHHWT